MSYETTRAAIAAKFSAEWPATTWPIVAENQPWPGGSQPAGPRCRYSVKPATNLTRVVDATAKQIVGLVWLQIFIPENQGTKQANLMADQMETMFAEKRMTTAGGLIRFERAEFASVGVDETGTALFRSTVRYREDEYVTP